MKHEPMQSPKLIGCATCSQIGAVLSKNKICAVGMGQVTLIVDDELIWEGDDENMIVGHLETFYSERIRGGECSTIGFYGPLHEETYEYNKEDGQWYLIKQGMGFA